MRVLIAAAVMLLASVAQAQWKPTKPLELISFRDQCLDLIRP